MTLLGGDKYRRLAGLGLLLALAACSSPGANESPKETRASTSRTAIGDAGEYVGSLSGLAYRIEIPANWHGLVLMTGAPQSDSPSRPPATAESDLHDRLLALGFGLAAVNRRGSDWAIRADADDASSLATEIRRRVPRVRFVVVTGKSYGGIVAAAAAELHPEVVSGSLPMCSTLVDTTRIFGLELDLLFAFFKLFDLPTDDLTAVKDLRRDIASVEAAASKAKQTALGRARLELVAALGDYSGWIAPESEPPTDADTVLEGQLTALTSTLAAALARRAASATHGNPVGNERVDYRAQLGRSIYQRQVEDLYRRAGADLDSDLESLQAARRIDADPHAAAELAAGYTFTGRLSVPVLSVDGTGDDWATPSQGDYAVLTAGAGAGALFRVLWVARPGHCNFAPTEVVAAVGALAARLESGRWPDLRPAAVNSRAGYGRFSAFRPPTYPRS